MTEDFEPIGMEQVGWVNVMRPGYVTKRPLFFSTEAEARANVGPKTARVAVPVYGPKAPT